MIGAIARSVDPPDLSFGFFRGERVQHRHHRRCADSGAQQDRTAIIAVPIDDENLIQWYIYYNPVKPVDSWRRTQRANQWPMAGGLPGDRSNNWGQNRQIMDAGNSTGFHEIVMEDFVVTVSMGPIGLGCAGSVTFHSPIVPLLWPLARVCLSGLNAAESTAAALAATTV